MAPSRPLRRLSVAPLLVLCAAVAAQVLPAFAGPRDLRVAAEGERGTGLPALPLPARTARATEEIAWSDVPRGHWARAAIDHVGGTFDWMRDYRPNEDGTVPFRPARLESRRLFARALVRAFDPDEPVDPAIGFADLVETDRFFPFANVAVKLGWLEIDAEGAFRPADPVATIEVHRALVAAAGLGDLAAGAEAIHLRDGTTFDVPEGFGSMLIGMRIGLRYNHGDEALDVLPSTPLARAEVAWSLYRAKTMPTWVPSYLAPYADIELPNLGPKKQAIVQWGIDFVGYPYVWGGEWYEPTAEGYCCGTQPVGGFDCSGITWWVMKAATETWDNVPPRPYEGWALEQRTSADMASVRPRLAWEEIRAGDLLFYDGDADGRVDHVDAYIGNGWAIDSSSGQGGVTIMWVGTGWYRDHFVHARRIIGTAA